VHCLLSQQISTQYLFIWPAFSCFCYFFVISLGRHLDFQNSIILHSTMSIPYCYNNFQVHICSFCRVLAAFVIFLLSLGRHLGLAELHILAFYYIYRSILYCSANSQINIFSFSQVLAVLVIFLLSLSRHLGFAEFQNFAFHYVNWSIFRLLTYFQVDIFSFG